MNAHTAQPERLPVTQAELDELPDVSALGLCLYTGEQDGVVWDVTGACWLVGWLNGERVKRSMRSNYEH